LRLFSALDPMNAELTARLVRLVRQRTTAALGTLRAGAPYVSMVPYAIVDDGFVIHVSRLAAHTKDMLADARVSLLVAEDGGKSPLALERVSVEGASEPIASDAPELPGFRAAYLARFPEAAQMFGFADFSLFLVRPVSARFVAGFGEAHSLTGASMVHALQQR
jgi:putative heme iron utilization protein